MASTPLPEIVMGSTTSRIRRRATAAITSALAAAAVLAALVVAAPTPASAAPRPPADPAGAFLFHNGRLTPLGGVPGATIAAHLNVNNRGQVVGLYIDDAEAATTPPGQLPPFRSFVKDRHGRVTTFAVPGASATLAAGINDRGQIAGLYTDPGCTPGSTSCSHGFIRQPDGRITTIDLPGFAATELTDINNRGQVVGRVYTTQGRPIGFLRDPRGRVTTIRVPAGMTVFKVLALNDRGQVAGGFYDANASPDVDGTVPNTLHGFVWDQGSGRLRRLDVPRSVATAAFGINNAGQITGAYADTTGNLHGFLLELRRGRYSRIDVPGRPQTDAAWGINDRGQIVLPEPGNGLAPVAT